MHNPFSGVVLCLPALSLGTSSLMTLSLNRRGTAELFELSRVARLVQSFEADPSRSVPKVWQKRLGPSADPDRWARHGRADLVGRRGPPSGSSVFFQFVFPRSAVR